MAEKTHPRIAWPLIFTYRGSVFGHGYIASVAAVSRILGIHEDDGIWLSGVQPRGVAAGGTDVWEACAAYRQAFVGVLADIASSVGDFAAFQAESTRMLAERDDAAFEDWAAAVEAPPHEPARLDTDAAVAREARGHDTYVDRYSEVGNDTRR